MGDEFVKLGPEAAAELVRSRVGEVPCVISFDIDVIEPGECPGSGVPEPGTTNSIPLPGTDELSGGMRSRELFTFLRGLRGVNCIGGEVNEFTPTYDIHEVTGHCCAQAAYEIMCLALDNVEPTK